ncbi:MAG: cytochrome c3 family protein [Pseudomonadota bacterium]|nr:cytochrome c3 family protein [Pseudomonadota bacterium]
MKKIFVLFIAVSFLAVAGFALAAPKAPAETLIFKAEKMKKPPVPFSHTKHAKVECSKCHHTWKGEGTPKGCGECHKDKKEGKKLGLKNAAHKTCRGCHRKLKKAGEKYGPTRCSKCHLK